MKNFLLGVLQKMYARRDARLATGGLAPDAGEHAARPHDAAALLARGEALEQARDFDGALQVYRGLLSLAPTALAQVCAGNALYALKRLEEAEVHYRAAIDLDPAYAAARLNLGNALMARGRGADAEASYREAAKLRPDWTEARAGVACALEQQGRAVEAIAAYRDVVRRDPAHTGASLNLGLALVAQGEMDAGKAVFVAALAHAPRHDGLRCALAHLHAQLSEHEQAVALYRQMLAENPDDEIWSSLLFELNFVPGLTATELLAEHRRWGEHVTARIRACHPQRDRDPQRRLRVGYMSPDFRSHPVALFIAPLLREHDADRFETFGYAGHERDDDITPRIRALAGHWRETRTLDDDALARLVEEDQIDLLVDLAGHSAGRRLGVFARRPAPVQLTWLGYLSTTGLPAMDYRICDAYSDPPGIAEAWQTETPLRLPDSQWCYGNPLQVPVGPLPWLRNGYWTFGSFNQLPKLNEPLFRSWARLMAAVPDSRLRIAGLPNEAALAPIRDLFAGLGIERERISSRPRVTLQQHLESHREVDVALDSFPYTGGTTTCDALCMGVPVATVAGHRSFERSGVSLLSNVGLTDWIAESLEVLPGLVQRQLEDPGRLARLREELPGRMRASPLMDASRFARNMEALYRKAWQRWCKAAPA